MTSYIIRRLLNLIPTFLLATIIAWFIIDLAPGDFATQFAFDQLDEDKEDRMREILGLDLPPWQRYFVWLKNLLLDGHWGTSLMSKGDVTASVIPRIGNSMWLLLPSTIIIYLIAIPIGVYSAVRKYSLGDRALTVFSLIGLAIPNFFLSLIVVALLVQYFQATGSFLLPTGGMTSKTFADMTWWQQRLDLGWHLIAPILVVTLSGLAGLTRVMRGQMLDVLGQDYIRTAKAKGLAEKVVNYKHAFKNAVLVIIATIGSNLPAILLGAGTVEFVMGWPGLTPYFIKASFAQDVYVVMAIITFSVILIMIGNLLSDIALAIVDPRIRY